MGAVSISRRDTFHFVLASGYWINSSVNSGPKCRTKRRKISRKEALIIDVGVGWWTPLRGRGDTHVSRSCAHSIPAAGEKRRENNQMAEET